MHKRKTAGRASREPPMRSDGGVVRLGHQPITIVNLPVNG